MFLGKQRDPARVSTAVAEESIHLCPIRDVSTSTFTDQWELVDIDRQARMVAHTSQHLFTKVQPETSDIDVAREDDTSPSPKLCVDTPEDRPLPENETQQHNVPKSKPFLDTQKKALPSQIASRITSIFSKSLTKSLGDDPENVEGVFAKIQEGLCELMRTSKVFSDLILYYSIRLLDSGGQPQFHEVASIVLPAVTGIVSIFKLSESLDVCGEVVFYKDGVQANDPYKSYLTNEQVIRHNLLAIQSVASHSGTEETPSLAFVGTFLDKKDSCAETPDQKDEKIQSMITEILPEHMQQSVISNSGSLRQVTFRVNTRTPSDEDYETARRLKTALMNQSRVEPKNLPLKWCGYEVTLRQMMERLERQTLSLQECQFIGHKLGFNPSSLKACLSYLRQLHIISMYDVVPHVVFGSCQVILDKITELVTLSLELKDRNCTSLGVDRKFHQQGIVSLEVLQSKACSKHYNNHFTPDHLLKILQSLLIVTKVTKGEYLMPCVLGVSDIYPSLPLQKDSIRSSFILHFSKKSPILGIYCCTISYLLTKAGWKLLTRDGEVVQVARNSTTFELPEKFAGKLTFLDPLSSHLEVVVELPQIVCKNSVTLFPKIRNTFITAVKQAMKILNYKVKTPELSFLCPEQSSRCSIFPHLATVDESHEYLTCSRNPGSVCHPLSPDQKIWLLKGNLLCRFCILLSYKYLEITRLYFWCL